ncbi:MAG: NmrA family NAD(P)-binding protein [Thiohalomonadales bacterium]
MKAKILVNTSTGKIGFAVAMQLLEKDYPVRAFVHRASARTHILKDAGAEIFIGNMLDIRDVRESLKDIQRSFYTFPVESNHLHANMIFATAANEVKLEVVTKLTQWFSNPVHPSAYTREHWLTDQVMSWMPNVDVITVNPGLFADNIFFVLEMIAQLGMMPIPIGDGLNAPPSNEDIARVVVGTLINPKPHIGNSYRPTGPALLSPQDTVEIFSKVLNKKVKYMDVSQSMFLKAMTALDFPEFGISQILHYMEEHKRTALTVDAPNTVVRDIGGCDPEDFETIARRYIADRPEAIQSVGNKLNAIKFFVKMFLTRTPDMHKYEMQHNHPMIKNPVYSSDSDEWFREHNKMSEATLVDKVGHNGNLQSVGQ